MNHVDPVRYAWEGCNLGIPFPAILGRNVFSPGMAALASGDAELVTETFAESKAVQAALQAFVIGDLRQTFDSTPVQTLEQDPLPPSPPIPPIAQPLAPKWIRANAVRRDSLRSHR
jgi:hypothetical protein